MRAKTFLRRNTREYSKLGSGRKKLQKWRSPKGRDNKMRLRVKSRPRTVEIGYKQDLRTRGKVEDKEVHFVQNIDDMITMKKGSVIMLGRMGAKKKLEMAKLAKEKDLVVTNFSFGIFDKTHKVKSGHRTKKKEARKKKKESKDKKEKKE
jgi:large subunit ribosomal protein L32e